MSLDSIHFTKVEKSFLQLLSDGLPHDRQELIQLIPHDQGETYNVNSWLYLIRKKIRPRGHDIICEWRNRKIYYRHVILLVPSHDV